MKYLLLIWVLSLVACGKSNKSEKEQIKLGQYTNNTNQTPLEKSMERGKAIYSDFCVQCHLPNGKGIPNNFPPLAGSDWLTDKRTESIHAVKYGQRGEIIVNGKKYDNIMAPMGLSDEEVADVLNYVMNSWGNTSTNIVTPEEVASVEK